MFFSVKQGIVLQGMQSPGPGPDHYHPMHSSASNKFKWCTSYVYYMRHIVPSTKYEKLYIELCNIFKEGSHCLMWLSTILSVFFSLF